VLGSEAPGFVEHRTEQAIMTNLAHKYGVRLHREACELGNSFPEDKDLFPQLFTQMNPWGQKTAPCVGSKFRNVTPSGARPIEARAFTSDDAGTACAIARGHANARNFRVAEVILQAALERFPGDFATLSLLAQVREAVRDFDGAAALFERAIAVNPGHAFPFTRRAIIRFRRRHGDPKAPKPFDQARPFVSMTSLGANGRFGNQLLQYGMLRLYAKRAGAQVLAPDWIGRDLFGLNDALPREAKLDILSEGQVVAAVSGGSPAPGANVDTTGYFCGDTSAWAAHRRAFQSFFDPVGAARKAGAAALQRLLDMGRTIVAIHARRGDFGSGQYWLAPGEWYRDWLRAGWKSLDRPVLYVATDDPAAVAEFAEFSPATADKLCDPLPGAEFFVDHWILRHADHLAVSNSTFSVTAALLNRKDSRFLRPDRTVGGLREFNPWAEKVLIE
jgi:tetratricopeptide (TPR) repeat protein